MRVERRSLERDGVPMLELETELCRFLVHPGAARVLEMLCLQTDQHMLAWWPMHLAGDPGALGGVGPSGAAAEWSWHLLEDEEAPERLSFVHADKQHRVWELTYRFGGPDLDATLRCAWQPPEPEAAVPPASDLALSAHALPGLGGAMPREGTGFLHDRHKLLAYHPALSPENVELQPEAVPLELWLEPFMSFRVGPSPFEWLALCDTQLAHTLLVRGRGGDVTAGSDAPSLDCPFEVAARRIVSYQDEVGLRLSALPGLRHVDAVTPAFALALETDHAILFPGAKELPLRLASLAWEPVVGELQVVLEGGTTTPPEPDADHVAQVARSTTVRMTWPVSLSLGGSQSCRLRVPAFARAELDLAPREHPWGTFYARGEIIWHRASDPAAHANTEQFGISRTVSAGPSQVRRDCRAAVRKAPLAARSDPRASLTAGCEVRLERETPKNARSFFPRANAIKAELDAVLASSYPSRHLFTPGDLDTIAARGEALDLAPRGAELRQALDEDVRWKAPQHRDYPGTSSIAGSAGLVLEAALLYTVTRDSELAALIQRRLRAFVALWQAFGTLKYETIHNSTVVAHLIAATELLAARGALPESDLAQLQALFLDLAHKIHRHQVRQHPLSNWKAMECMTPALVAALHPSLPTAGEWLGDAGATCDRLLGQGTFADGAFWEMSVSYHLVTLWALCWIGEALLRAPAELGGRDLFTARVGGRSLDDMACWAARLAIGGGQGPRFHDAAAPLHLSALMHVAKRSGSEQTAALALAAGWREGVDDLLVPLPPPTTTPALLESLATEPSGKVVLRLPDDRAVLVMDFGPHTGWHCHYCRMSIELHARGIPVVPDAGMYRYEEALHNDWFKATPSHNTVTLGDRNQMERGGELVHFDAAEQTVTARAETYPGVLHQRSVAREGEGFRVRDELRGAAEATPLVWRLNSFVRYDVEGRRAMAQHGGVALVVEWDGEPEVEVVPVPLMPQEPTPQGEPVTGWQLRLTQPADPDCTSFDVRLTLHP